MVRATCACGLSILLIVCALEFGLSFKDFALAGLRRRLAVGIAGFGLATTAISPVSPGNFIANAKDELPSLDRCFAAVKRELDPKEGVSLQRLKKDIDEGDWGDLKLFTREYDAGFRGGVLKKSWKQLGDKKADGIRISNSFTFDLIGLNQAARKEDKDSALQMYEAVRNDIVEFAKLE
tara:strand:- start:276 stop:812 length:537 start_codon:yes stop_codon:yes gene_type:complete